MRKFFKILSIMLSAWCFAGAGIIWTKMHQVNISFALMLMAMLIAIGLCLIWGICNILCANKNVERSNNNESN